MSQRVLSIHENFVSCRLAPSPTRVPAQGASGHLELRPQRHFAVRAPNGRSVQALSLLNPHRALMSAFKELEATITVNWYGPRRAAGFKY